MMRIFVVAITTVATFSIAAAQGDPPQVERWELMDEIGSKTQLMGEMVKRERPFDAEAVDEALLVLIDHGERFPTLFPEGSDTRALPAIWENRADFEAKSRNMVEAARAARTAADGGLEAFAVAFRDLGQTCRACHTEYRAEDD